MRPLRYSINVTLDGCCDHRAIPADEELHRHAVENLNQARTIDAAKKYVVSSTLDRGELGSGAVAMRYEPRR
jgi:hypothetical protein